jgi:hypothetical protein
MPFFIHQRHRQSPIRPRGDLTLMHQLPEIIILVQIILRLMLLESGAPGRSQGGRNELQSVVHCKLTSKWQLRVTAAAATGTVCRRRLLSFGSRRRMGDFTTHAARGGAVWPRVRELDLDTIPDWRNLVYIRNIPTPLDCYLGRVLR